MKRNATARKNLKSVINAMLKRLYKLPSCGTTVTFFTRNSNLQATPNGATHVKLLKSQLSSFFHKLEASTPAKED